MLDKGLSRELSCQLFRFVKSWKLLQQFRRISPDWDLFIASECDRIPLEVAKWAKFVQRPGTAKIECYIDAKVDRDRLSFLSFADLDQLAIEEFGSIADMSHLAVEEFNIDSWETAEPFIRSFATSGTSTTL